jgi:uncharacterized membrane protein
MNNLVENYLSEVAAYLKSLPAKRREEELREMRQHLLNAVTANQETGMIDDQAVQKALEQFGTPEALGKEVMVAWQRGRKREIRDFWGAALMSVALVPCLIFLLPYWYFSMVNVAFGLPMHWMAVVEAHSSFFLVCALTGAMTGRVFPARAVGGTAFGAVVLVIAWMRPIRFPAHLSHFQYWVEFWTETLAWAVVGVAAALAVSRGRGTRTTVLTSMPRRWR